MSYYSAWHPRGRGVCWGALAPSQRSVPFIPWPLFEIRSVTDSLLAEINSLKHGRCDEAYCHLPAATSVDFLPIPFHIYNIIQFYFKKFISENLLIKDFAWRTSWTQNLMCLYLSTLFILSALWGGNWNWSYIVHLSETLWEYIQVFPYTPAFLQEEVSRWEDKKLNSYKVALCWSLVSCVVRTYRRSVCDEGN